VVVVVVLALLLNFDSEVIFVAVSLKSSAVYRRVARMKEIRMETCVITW
jgi:hypothetical protein